ncbi:MAG: flagella basal body P-ring formation protein FlgA, partial [Myxococcota bacterium]
APQEIWARVDADITVPTLVVVSALPRGASVTNADITQVMRPWVAGKLHRPAEALGRVTRRALRAGDTLEAGILTLPNVVRRGQRVTAIVSGASFRIRTAAEVLEPGPIGATIAVRVSVSGKRLQARVVGPDMVEVLQ